MRLQDIASHIGADLCSAGPDIEIEGLASLSSAGPGHLSFLVSADLLELANQSRAGALICPHDLVQQLSQQTSCPLLASKQPYLAYAHASGLFTDEAAPAGIHPSASVDKSVEMADDVHIGANAVVGPGVRLAAGVAVGSGCQLGRNVQIGEATRLFPNVVLYHGVRLGSDCILHSGAVLGADGFGFAPSANGWVKIHQLGTVIVGDRVEIGPNCTVARGALDDTRIGNGVIMDAQVLIAHNVEVGENTAFAGQSGAAGSARIGANCTFGGQSGVVGHIEIADNVHLQGRSVITKSIYQAGSYSSLWPQLPAGEWRRMVASLRHAAKKKAE